MRPILFLLVLAGGLSAHAEGTPVRNPFWPIGHDGKREVISADYHLARARELEEARLEAERRKAAEEEAARLKAAEDEKRAAAAALKAAASRAQAAKALAAKRDPNVPATDVEWTAALRQIRIGGRIRARRPDGTESACVVLDGKPYADGDLKTISFAGRRYTWRVTGLSGDGKSRVRLERVKDRAENTKEGERK